MIRRIAVAVAATIGLAAVSATGAAAAGNPGTVSMTQHAHNVVLFSMPVTNPCTGQAGTLTAVSANEVFHVTFFSNGDEFWVTGTDEGTATFTPNDPSGVSASGHFASWFGASGNNRNNVMTDTNNFQLTGSDGSHTTVHATDHVTMNANGVVTSTFSNFKFSCG